MHPPLQPLAEWVAADRRPADLVDPAEEDAVKYSRSQRWFEQAAAFAATSCQLIWQWLFPEQPVLVPIKSSSGSMRRSARNRLS